MVKAGLILAGKRMASYGCRNGGRIVFDGVVVADAVMVVVAATVGDDDDEVANVGPNTVAARVGVVVFMVEFWRGDFKDADVGAVESV